MAAKAFKKLSSLLVLLYLFQISYGLELMVNGTLLPCEKKKKDDFTIPFHTIENCFRKIRLVINILNSGKTPEGIQYIYVKEVTELKTGLKMRLLNPIVLQLRQDQVVLAYPFKYLSAVNGKVSEIVVNKENTANYSGCDDTSSINPTCGIKTEKGVHVPYSEGFCCYCPEKPVNIKHPRGGQDCSLQTGPNDEKGRKYKASAHCLHFSDIWFSVSALGDPIIIHNLYLEVFNQRHLANKTSVWVSLTGGQQFELGHKNPSHYDDNRTIVVTYMTGSPKNSSFNLSAENHRLLIPQTLPGIGVDKLPPVIKNGAKDYLILEKKIVNSKGDECDKAGVSYEAFAKQNDRCGTVKDTCLKNQPLDFWAGDNEKRKSGRKGRYLLQNYAIPNKDPIIVDLDTKEHWLALEYHEKHFTVLTVEFNADDVIALSVGLDAQITSVITGMYEKKIEFTVVITNNGLVEAKLSVKVKNCEFKVPDSNNVTKVIPPQLMKTYILTSIPASIQLIEKFKCTVVVTSKSHGVVAKRDVILKPSTRCICNWHCRCACLGESLTCVPLAEDNYHQAGFKGGRPILTAKSPPKAWIWAHPYLTMLITVFVLLILGIVKAILGLLGCEKCGYFGLESRIYRPGALSRYTEPELQGYDVVYDEEDYPIHPTKYYRTKALPNEIICILNIVFFFIWPLLNLSDFCASRREEVRSSRRIKHDAISSSESEESSGSEEEEPEALPTENKRDASKPHSVAHVVSKQLVPRIIEKTKEGAKSVQKRSGRSNSRALSTDAVSKQLVPRVIEKAKERAKSVQKRSEGSTSRALPTVLEDSENEKPHFIRSASDGALTTVSGKSWIVPQWHEGGRIVTDVIRK